MRKFRIRGFHLAGCLAFVTWCGQGCGPRESADVSFETRLLRAEEYRIAGKVDEAVSECRKAADTNPSSWEAHYCLGLAYNDKWRILFRTARGRYIEEIIRSQEAVQRDASQGHHSYYGEDGKLKEMALAEFQEAVRLKPEAWQPRYYVATEYFNSGMYENAVAEYAMVLERNPNLGIAYGGVASAYRMLGKWPLAIENYKKAISMDPKDEYAIYELGVTYLRAGDTKKAKEQFDRLKEMKSIFYESARMDRAPGR